MIGISVVSTFTRVLGPPRISISNFISGAFYIVVLTCWGILLSKAQERRTNNICFFLSLAGSATYI